MNIVDYYSNKEVSFRFAGKNLSFFLSQSLFSSFDIDAGSKLLLKTLIKKCNLSDIKSVLDVGCGVGTIGISLKKSFPSMEITLQDRDALASYFSRINGEKNGIMDTHIITGLAFEELSEKRYDLIVSNLPAKAGTPVMQHFITESLSHLSEEGIAAVVVVSTLHNIVEEILERPDIFITHRDETNEYSVFHYKKKHETSAEYTPGSIRETISPLAPYIRTSTEFRYDSYAYPLDTVYGLPGFDTVPYADALTASLPLKYTVSGDVFIWNPGQGHIPAILISRRSNIKTLTLSSRDVLQCLISSHNCNILQASLPVRSFSNPSPLSAFTDKQKSESPHVWMIYHITETIEKKILPAILKKARDYLTPESFLLFTGKSSLLAGIASEHQGYSISFSKKHRGFRILLLQKR